MTVTKHPIDKMNVGQFSHGHFGQGGLGQDISTTENAKGGRFGHDPKFGQMVWYLCVDACVNACLFDALFRFSSIHFYS